MNRIEALDKATMWSRATWARLEKMYPGKLGPMPEIRINARFKTTAGRCFWELRMVEYSLELFTEYPENFRLDMIPHELAHQVAFDLFPASVKRCHGAEWQGVMLRLGIVPSRCHEMVNTLHAKRKAK